MTTEQLNIHTIHRWNFTCSEDGVEVCRGNHEKHEGCRFEKLEPLEVVGIITWLISQITREEISTDD